MEWRARGEAGDSDEGTGEQRDTLRPSWNPNAGPDAIWGSLLDGVDDVGDDDDAEPLEPADEAETTDEPERLRWWWPHADRWGDAEYRRRIQVVPAEQRPAPFQRELAEGVPEWGTKGTKTTGTVKLDGGTVDLLSGYDGPARTLADPGPEARMTRGHVEAHCAATMRIRGVAEATLYINRIPCPSQGRYRGCDEMLPAMLPRGAKLTVYAPEGFCRVYRGLEDDQR